MQNESSTVTTPGRSPEQSSAEQRRREIEAKIRGKSAEAAAALLLEEQGLTEERLGPEEWARALREGIVALELRGGSTTPDGGRPPAVGGLPSMEQIQEAQRRNREKATAAELEAAELKLSRQREEEEQRAARLAAASCKACGDAGAFLTTRDPKSPRFGLAVPCPECVSLEQRARLAGVPRRFAGATLEAMRPLPGKADAIAWAADRWSMRSSVVIASRTDAGDSMWGTGKTHLACAMLSRVLEAGGFGRFVFVTDFLEEIKARYGDSAEEQAKAYVDRIASEPLLVLDDLGAERPTGWALEQLRALLDRRYRHQLPTIITTNFTHPGEVAEALGGAVASRLREAEWLLVGGQDLRGAGGAEERSA